MHFNLKFEYPLQFECLMWGYKNKDSQSVNRAIQILSGRRLFQSKGIHNQIKIFIEKNPILFISAFQRNT